MPLKFYFNVQLTGSIDTSSTNDSTEDKPRDLEKLKDTLKALFCYCHTFSRLRLWVVYFIYFKLTPLLLFDVFNGCSIVQLRE